MKESTKRSIMLALELILVGAAIMGLALAPALIGTDDIDLREAAISGPPPSTTGIPGFSYKTERYEVGEIGHESFKGGGQFSSGTDCKLPGCELFDSNRFLASWQLGGISEKIIVGGTTEYTKHEKWFGGVETSKEKYTLEKYVNGQWNLYKTSPPLMAPQGIWKEGSWVYSPTHIFYYDGVFNGYIRANHYVEYRICDSFFGVRHCTPWEWELVTKDDAYLADGRGSIEIDNPNDIVEVNEDLIITVDVGYATPFLSDSEHSGSKSVIIEDQTVPVDGRGWSLFVYSYAQNKVVATFHPPDNDITTYRYKVTSADFKATTDCLATNKLMVKLYNEVNLADYKKYPVIDDKKLGPSKPKVTLDKTYYETGEDMYIYFKSDPNAQTKAIIKHYEIDINYVKPLFPVYSGITTKEEYKIGMLPEEGILEISVIAFDNYCRPSPKETIQVKIHEPTALGGIPWLLIIVLIIMIGMIAFVWLRPLQSIQTKYPTTPIFVWKIIITIIIIVALLCLYFFFLQGLEEILFFSPTGPQS